jgi:hypothetical protein
MYAILRTSGLKGSALLHKQLRVLREYNASSFEVLFRSKDCPGYGTDAAINPAVRDWYGKNKHSWSLMDYLTLPIVQCSQNTTEINN